MKIMENTWQQLKTTSKTVYVCLPINDDGSPKNGLRSKQGQILVRIFAGHVIKPGKSSILSTQVTQLSMY